MMGALLLSLQRSGATTTSRKCWNLLKSRCHMVGTSLSVKATTRNSMVLGSLAKKPKKGFVSSRPGVAEYCGFDGNKYGTGALANNVSLDDDILDNVGFVSVGAKKGSSKAAAMDTIPVGLLFPGQGSQYV